MHDMQFEDPDLGVDAEMLQEAFDADLAQLLERYEENLSASEMVDSLHAAVASIVSDLEDF